MIALIESSTQTLTDTSSSQLAPNGVSNSISAHSRDCYRHLRAKFDQNGRLVNYRGSAKPQHVVLSPAGRDLLAIVALHDKRVSLVSLRSIYLGGPGSPLKALQQSHSDANQIDPPLG